MACGTAGAAGARPHLQVDIVSCLQQILEEERLVAGRILAQRHENVLARLQQQLLDPQPGEDQSRPPQVDPAKQGKSTPALLPIRSKTANSESVENGGELQQVAENGDEPAPLGSKSSLSDGLGGLEHAPRSEQSIGAQDTERRRRIKRMVTDLVLDEPPSFMERRQSVKDFLHLRLDVVSGILLCLYIIMVALMAEYQGIELAHEISSTVKEFQGSRPATEVWPGAQEIFQVLEWCFGLFWCTELVTRLVFQINLRQDRLWNLFDAVIIFAFFIEQFGSSGLMPFDPTILRVARLFRLMRLLKLVRFVKAFDALHLMVKAIASTMSVLSWTVMLIFMLMLTMAVANTSLLGPFIRDPNQDSEARAHVYERWGTFFRAYISMFEITLANWGPQCWFLVNHVHAGWGCFFIMWRCCVGFAVVQVIISVFIQHTFKTASQDEDIMIADKAKASEVYLKHLDNLFTELDEHKCGVIVKAEFEVALEQPRVRHWFAALEIDVSDVPKVFELLDDGSGEISKADFIPGLRNLKGFAKGMDMIRVLKDLGAIRAVLGDAGIDEWQRRKETGTSGPHWAERKRTQPRAPGDNEHDIPIESHGVLVSV